MSIVRIFLISLILGLVFSQEAPEWLKIYDTKQAKYVTFNDLKLRLSQAHLVIGGEYHDHNFGHQTELYLTKTFHSLHNPQNNNFALALEMFERDCQPFVTMYAAKQLDETNFIRFSRPWPNYIKDYKPMVDFCQSVGQIVIGANVPRRYAAFVASRKESQLFSMPPQELSFMAKNITSPRDKYWEKFYEMMKPHVPEDKIWDYYRSQCLKDDTMAMSIDEFMTSGEKRLISFMGSFHSDDYLGTWSRMKNTYSKLLIKIAPYKEMSRVGEMKGIADLILFAPDN
jgi:uncharacterized iron-regulated protein